MTIVAWDGETLAADRRTCVGIYKAASVTKIFRVPGGLVGISGLLSVGLQIKDWILNEGKPEDYPDVGEDNEATVLWIRPKKILLMSDSPTPVALETPHFAIGSGSEYALAAMHLGCTAREAVDVACDLDVGCGNGVDILTLEDAL